MTVRVFCVLKSGGDFDASDVARLQVCLKKHAPGFELHCLTDVDVPCSKFLLTHDWPGWWSKMELFRPGITGDIFYLDLDTVLVGNITPMLLPREDTMLNDFYYPWRPASAMMYLTEKFRSEVWDRWIVDPDRHMRESLKGDQAFLGTIKTCLYAKRWQRDFPAQIISFKFHMRPSPPLPVGPQLASPPLGARVICFHGVPRPKQIAYEPWVQEAWRE